MPLVSDLSMTLRLLLFPALAAAGIFLTSCASTGPQTNPAVTASVNAHDVNQATTQKIIMGQPLDYSDIYNLVSKGVPSNVIVGYLISTKRVYNLSFAQLQSLRSAGAAPQVLNYLTETQGFYGNNSPKQVAKTKQQLEQKGQYLDSRHYQDQAPFAYNEPIVDGWYDSAYSESLYSPFSFN
jgi:hypothetical protein